MTGTEWKKKVLESVRDVLKLAKNDPKGFDEALKKMAPAPAAAPSPAPAAAKPAAKPAPKAPPMKMGAMSKEEIKEDLKKPWEPKFKKEGSK